MPQEYDASKEFANKKVVLVSVPGAFTPGCQAFHIPPYLQNAEKIAGKGVDLTVIIASNDSWVMSAWGKVNGVKGDSKTLFMSDTKTFFSKEHGWQAGMGDRNGRWAMIVEKDGTISYAENEKDPRQVTVSTNRCADLCVALDVLTDNSYRFLVPRPFLESYRCRVDRTDTT
jgi:alkyl hydroperoxide reductase 1